MAHIELSNSGTPATPALGRTDIFVDSGDGHVKRVNDSGVVVDLEATGSGDVVGPGSATDGAPVAFDGTTGKLVKDPGGFRFIDAALCVKLTNSTGGLISKGTPVTADGAVDLATLIATNATEEEIIGVCMEDSTDPGGGADIWIATGGVFPVNCTGGAVVRGNFLMMSATAGLASDTVTGSPGVFAIAMEAKGGGGAGQVLAMFIKSETF